MACYAWCVLVLMLIGVPHCTGKGCNDFYKGPGPQSTFQIPEDGQSCSSARAWIKATFTATSNSTESSLDVSNFTATVTRVHTSSEYETSITMCSSLGDRRITKNPWPNGSYCIPVADLADCEDGHTKHELTITAPGRTFHCGTNTNPSPLFNCTADSFSISACCPKNMTGEPYLTVPFYNSTFYLIKANTPCPQAYSFTVSEENIALAAASAKGDLAQFVKSDNGSIRLHFCKYTPVKCEKAVNPSLTFYTYDACTGDSRRRSMICDKSLVQPDNIEGPLESMCLPSGQYSHSDKFCGIQCPALVAPNNATLSSNTTQCDTTVTVSCGDGSVLRGASNTTCQRNGTWSSDITTTNCTYVECPESELNKRSNREWNNDGTPNPFSYGHSVQYWCEKRDSKRCYHLEGDVDFLPVTCQADGTWTDIPACLRGGQCTNPGNTSSATVNTTDTKFNCDQSVTYTCPLHHISETPLTLTCEPNITSVDVPSVWDYPPPECNLTVCNDPQLYLSNGEVEGISPPRNDTQLNNTRFNVGDVVGYQCNVLYTLRGDDVIECQSNGTWNTTADHIICWKVQCPEPPSKIAHGFRTDDNTEYNLNTEITYSCDESGVEAGRYELNYTGSVSCDEEEHWAPYIPTCVEVTCDTPPFVNHSEATPGPFAYNTTYIYTCKPGFSLTNSSPLVCGIGGWKYTSLPTCEPVLCKTAPPPFSNGTYTAHYNSTSYSYGREAPYTCHQGYNCSVGDSLWPGCVTTCSQDGTWSPAPACNTVFCLNPGIPHSVLNHVKPLYNYNESVVVTCNKHMAYQPAQLLTCGDNGGWVTNATTMLECYSFVTDPILPDIHHDKFIFIGCGGLLFVLLIVVIICLVRRRRRHAGADLGLEPFADTRQFSVNTNPTYKASTDKAKIEGFDNPGFEEEPVHSFSINKNKGRLVLHDEAGYTSVDASNRLSKLSVEAEQREWADSSTSSLNYDTLRSRNIKPTIVSEPLEGEYNTLSRMDMARPEYDEEGHYNVISTTPAQMEEEEEEDIYNVPTNSLRPVRQARDSFAQSEVNEMYSNKSAAQLCGTPIEEDFDNMIYDNI